MVSYLLELTHPLHLSGTVCVVPFSDVNSDDVDSFREDSKPATNWLAEKPPY
jgi:hypothetical protein